MQHSCPSRLLRQYDVSNVRVIAFGFDCEDERQGRKSTVRLSCLVHSPPRGVVGREHVGLRIGVPIINRDCHLAYEGVHGGAKIDTGGIRELSTAYYVVLRRVLRLENNSLTLTFSNYLHSIQKPIW